MPLHVDADIPCGSLGPVEVLGPDRFVARLVPDANFEGRNHTAIWYHFKVSGCGPELSFTLDHLLDEWNHRPSQPFNALSRPLYSFDRVHWQPIPEVSYDPERYALTARLAGCRPEVWIACLEPHGLADQAAWLEEIRRRGGTQIDSIGRSAEGRELTRLTLGNPRDAQGRPAPTAWVIARQHPWETHTTFAAQALVERLLEADPAPRRAGFCVCVVPVANPDGVARAGTRYNACRRDPNRDYARANLDDSPESYWLQRALAAWCDEGRRLDLFINIHNTTTDYIDAYKAPLADGRPYYFGGLLARRSFFRGPVRYQETEPFALPDKNGLNLVFEMRAWHAPALGRQVLAADARAMGRGLAEAIGDYLTSVE